MASQAQVLANGEVRRSATEGILEYTADQLGPRVFRPPSYVLTSETDAAFINEKGPRYRVQKRRFSGPVRADNDYPRAGFEVQANAAQRMYFVRCACVEGLGNGLNVKLGCSEGKI